MTASDAERASAERALAHHYAQGRIEPEELERRLDRVYTAPDRRAVRRTYRDLPRPREKSRLRRAHRIAVRLHASGSAAFNGSVIGVWAVTGGGAFWPAVTIVPSAGLLAWHAYGLPWAFRRARQRLRRR